MTPQKWKCIVYIKPRSYVTYMEKLEEKILQCFHECFQLCLEFALFVSRLSPLPICFTKRE